MSAQHTPGPWKWDGVDLDGPNCEPVIHASVSCGQWCQGGSVQLTMSERDRALIEAAPQLLEAARAGMAYCDALEQCANDPERMSSFCTAEGDDLDALFARWGQLSNEAIAKATGSAA